MILRQLFDQASSTFTYLVADEQTREALLIDCVFEQHARDSALIRELGLRLLATLDTHCHADHVTGAWLMKKTLGSRIGLSPVYGATNVDLPLVPGTTIRFGAEALEVRATPGHTSGCLSFVSADRSRVFTGDALLVRSAGRTDFQEGSARRLFHSIQQELFTLPDACVLYPGHDYQGRITSTIGEERRFNPRIGGGAREEDFVGYMENLQLPHPKQLAVALPANLRCGEPDPPSVGAPAEWGPVYVTYAGIPELPAEWVSQHLGKVQVLDVRTPPELEGPFGPFEGAQHIPLDELRTRLAEVKRDRPVVTVCQTGKRSAMATEILRKAGLERVANLAGGMVAWREL
jgi:glyoxylase-like metal-dependent hydrolase (beta-lactamase superfamily II)/rhodanese-related sulfurtransferase